MKIIILKFDEAMATMKKEVLAYDLIAFLSDIGGSLGLMVGFSLYGMFDICKNYFVKR